MKNEHLIAPIILDVCEKVLSVNAGMNEKVNLVMRLEANRDIINETLNIYNAKNQQLFKRNNSRK